MTSSEFTEPGELLSGLRGILQMTCAGSAFTVRGMRTRIPKAPDGHRADWSGSSPYAELRRRNERRDRVAELLEARRERLANISRSQRESKTRHAG
jgi:hypothetical protein